MVCSLTCIALWNRDVNSDLFPVQRCPFLLPALPVAWIMRSRKRYASSCLKVPNFHCCLIQLTAKYTASIQLWYVLWGLITCLWPVWCNFKLYSLKSSEQLKICASLKLKLLLENMTDSVSSHQNALWCSVNSLLQGLSFLFLIN